MTDADPDTDTDTNTDTDQTDSLHRYLDGHAARTPQGGADAAVDLGSRIAEARAAAGRTQSELANHLGVKASTVDKWERGESSPRSNRLMALAGLLGVSVSWLMVGYGSRPGTGDELDEVKSALIRVQTQLAEALRDVEAVSDRLDRLAAAD